MAIASHMKVAALAAPVIATSRSDRSGFWNTSPTAIGSSKPRRVAFAIAMFGTTWNGAKRSAVKRGTEEATTEVISGRGHEGPKVMHIPYYHGNKDGDLVVTVGKEEQDNGEEAAAAAA